MTKETPPIKKKEGLKHGIMPVKIGEKTVLIPYWTYDDDYTH